MNRPEAFETAKKWLTECINSHDQCSILNESANGARISPRRLLKLRREISGNIKLKLHICKPDDCPHYAALSYCWGRDQPYKLTLSRFEAMCIDIPMLSLAQSLQDAVSVAFKMGLCYLWVDALCIIQDSTADKDTEISVMDHIYQNADFTIWAASARYPHPEHPAPALDVLSAFWLVI